MLDNIFRKYPHPDVNRIDSGKFEKFPTSTQEVPSINRQIYDLPLGELESVLFLQEVAIEDLAKHFRINGNDLEQIRQHAADTLSHKRRRNTKNSQHARHTVYGLERAKPYENQDIEKLTLPPPRTEDHKKMARRIFERVKNLAFSADHENVKNMLC